MKTIMEEMKDAGYKNSLNKELEKNYNEELKDNNFKEFVSKIKTKDEILMKYTSSLKESFCEYNHCMNCKSILECKNKIEGYAYLPKKINDSLEFNYKACKYKEKLNKETKYLNNVYMLDMPDFIKEARFKNIYTKDQNRFEAFNYIINFEKEYPNREKGLFLSGNFGSGKTYFIASLFNELALKERKSAIIFWPEFLRNLKSSFGTDYEEKFEKIRKSPLLLIDDIGAENLTAWSRDEVLCPIMQYRMEEKLPTFFTSNFNIDELEEHLSMTGTTADKVKAKRIIERINQMTDKIEMKSKNLRK